jgi:arabinofuranosyltransferase
MSKNRPVLSRSLKPASARNSSVSFLALLLSGGAIVYGLYRAISLRWISDDAFITMRYVKNFLDGNGLVYNIGDRVEGYTHFLWLLLLSAAGAIGFDPVDASQWLGIASFVGILILLLLASHREHKKTTGMWLPIALAIFVLNYDDQVWASGGLETSFYTLLIFGAFFVWFYSKYSETTRLLLVGLLLGLISLTRPDGVLFTFCGALLLLVRSRHNIRNAFRPIASILLPSIVVGLPYLLWKYSYYGDLLPLTYYAKSGGSNYWSQGFYYILLYFRVHYVLGLALIGSIFVLFRKNTETQETATERGSPVIVAAVASVTYLSLFVARSGGDFMFARFLIPVTPLLCLLVESALYSIRLNAGWQRFALAACFLMGLVAENTFSPLPYFTMEDGKRQEDWNRVVRRHTLDRR